jgi:hypothetical protein
MDNGEATDTIVSLSSKSDELIRELKDSMQGWFKND